MPTVASPPLLVDTSVAVALVLADHHHHEGTSAALAGRELGLSGHAAFETFSVLSRLPAPARRSPATVGRILAASFPHSRFLDAAATQRLLSELGPRGVAGGSVYDALVGAAAVKHGCVLVSRDRRVLSTYRALDVRVELLD